ncbi:TPA: hypothetical protein J8I68_004442, partial [Escherichia coli]|nr:hypothetical protein [Escherichia coli]
ADMNAKFVFAVILALQVSLSLCEIPQPDADLVEKYNDMKNTFIKRIHNAYAKLSEVASTNEDAQAAKEALTNLQNRQEMEKYFQVAKAVGEEMTPAIDKARSAVLGVYSAYLRPFIGEYLQDGINQIKVVLDQVMPADKQ